MKHPFEQYEEQRNKEPKRSEVKPWMIVVSVFLCAAIISAPLAMAQPLDPGTAGTGPVVGSTGSFTDVVSTTKYFRAQTASTSTNEYGLIMCSNQNARIGAQCGGAGVHSLDFYATASASIQWSIDGTTGDLTYTGDNNLRANSVHAAGDFRATTNAGVYYDTAGTKRIYYDGTNLVTNASFDPSTDKGVDLGTASLRWGSLHVASVLAYPGTSTTAGLGVGALTNNVTGVGNVGASGPDDLQTYTLAANTLVSNGRCVRIYAAGTTGATTNAKTVRLTIGPTPTAIITKQLQQASATASTWEIKAVICRTGANTQDFYAEAYNNGGTAQAITDGPTILKLGAFGTLTQTETNALDIKVQTTVSTSNDDVRSELLQVEAM